MKRIFALLLLLTVPAWAVVAITEEPEDDSITKITYTWISNGSGTATGQTVNRYTGVVLRVVFNPDDTDAPTDNYDVTITDNNSVDILDGQGADLDEATTTQISSPFSAVLNSKLRINVSGAGASNAGQVILYFSDDASCSIADSTITGEKLATELWTEIGDSVTANAVGDIESVTAGDWLTGGGTTGAVTLAVDSTEAASQYDLLAYLPLTAVGDSVNASLPDSAALYDSLSGAWQGEISDSLTLVMLKRLTSDDFHNLGGTDANTTYTAGTGLDLTSTTFSVEDGGIGLIQLATETFFPNKKFLGVSFDNNDENLRILSSDDGFTWELVHQTTYNGDLRDPSIIRYGDYYYVCYTNGFTSINDFAIARSSDLENWTIHDTVSTANVQGLIRTWSPRFFVDDDFTLRVFVGCKVYASTAFNIYETHPLNAQLTEWSDPQLLVGNFPKTYQDADFIKVNGTYYIFYNDYTVSNGRIGYATSNDLLYGWEHQGTLWDGYEGPSVVQIDDSTFYAYMDDLINSGTQGTFYSISVDTMNTWSVPTVITSDAPTVNRNMRVVYNSQGMGFLTDKTYSGKVAENYFDKTEPSSPSDGQSFIKQGTVSAPDTFMVYTGGRWQKFPGQTTHTAKATFTDNDDTVLHLTFNDQIVDSKGANILTSGSVGTFASGHNPGSKSLYFDGASYLYLSGANSGHLSFGKDTSFTISVVAKLEQSSKYNMFVTKRDGTRGYSTSTGIVNNILHGFYGDGANFVDLDGVCADSMNWELYTFVFDTDSDSLKTYRNSQYVYGRSFATITGSPANDGVWYFGRYGANYLKGWVSEIFIEQRKRTKSEIINDYTSGWVNFTGIAGGTVSSITIDSTNTDHLVVNTTASLPAGSLEAADIALAQNSILVGNVSGQAAAATDLPTATTIGTAYVYRAGGTDVADADVVDTITASNYLLLTAARDSSNAAISAITWSGDMGGTGTSPSLAANSVHEAEINWGGVDEDSLTEAIRDANIYQSQTFTFLQPDSIREVVTDSLVFYCFDDLSYPNGAKLGKVRITASAAVTDTIAIYEYSTRAGAAIAVIDSFMLSSSQDAESLAVDLDDSDMAADSWLCLDLSMWDATCKTLEVTIVYYVKSGD